MNENKEHSSESSGPGRDFDWGPPANSFYDSISEWIVYFFLLLLLLGGIWILLDINSKKVIDAGEIISKTMPSITTSIGGASVNEQSPSFYEAPEERTGNFLVQLGAFADKASAMIVFESMVAKGFSPKLSEPDSQFEIYRISIGPFITETEAEEMSEKLNSLDFHCFVIESP